MRARSPKQARRHRGQRETKLLAKGIARVNNNAADDDGLGLSPPTRTTTLGGSG